MAMNLFNAMFGNDPYETIKEGPVEIHFDKSTNGKIKVTYVVDYGKIDISPGKASDIMSSIVNILRATLGVKLSKCR